MSLLRAGALNRTYGSGHTAVHACRDVDLTVAAGELLVVKGPSGSGKTTLLNLLGGLDRPTSGHVLLDDVDLAGMTERELVEIRRRRIGYVFQSFGLIPILTARENVEVPLRLLRTPRAERDRVVTELLEAVGLSGHTEQRPDELSGGQQQRVALARALTTEPEILIADEPTGQLDLETGRAVMDLIRSVVHERSMTAVVATHDPVLIDLADRVVELRDGHPVTATRTS